MSTLYCAIKKERYHAVRPTRESLLDAEVYREYPYAREHKIDRWDPPRRSRRTPVVPTSWPVINFALNSLDLLPPAWLPSGPYRAPGGLFPRTSRDRLGQEVYLPRTRTTFHCWDASHTCERECVGPAPARLLSSAFSRAERIASGTAAPEIEGIALTLGVAINSIESRYISKIKARARARCTYLTRSIPPSVAPRAKGMFTRFAARYVSRRGSFGVDLIGRDSLLSRVKSPREEPCPRV